MTLALEHVQEGDWAALNRVVDALRSLVVDTGGRSIVFRFGIATLTFSASTNSAGVTVTHGLGRVPQVVVATAVSANFGNIPLGDTQTWTTTTFLLFGETKSAFTGTAQMCWVAIG